MSYETQVGYAEMLCHAKMKVAQVAHAFGVVHAYVDECRKIPIPVMGLPIEVQGLPIEVE